MITERFKISRGRKSREVLIPGEILKSEPKILLACIAGIYDAEVSVYSDKRKIYKKPYPIIELHMTNPHLIKQISEIFNRQNIKHYVRGSYSRIYIYGDSAIMDFLRKVKFLNPKNVNNLRKIGF